MALGALIAAYQEDDSGGLRALLPLSGRTLIEYQVRCAAAAGAAPVVVMVERIPASLNDAFERLRQESIPVIPVSDASEGATRFEPGSSILLIGDGVVPPAEVLAQLAEEREPAVATVPDDELHAGFEPAHRFVHVADREDPDPVEPQPLERVLQSLRNPLDDHDDRSRADRCRAACLVFEQGPPGERKQGTKPAGIVLLIGTEQRTERHPPSPSSKPRDAPL